MDSLLIVKNLTNISKIVFFCFFCFFALTCNLFDGMNASVLMKVNVMIWSLLKEKRWDPVRFSATPLSQYIKWLSHYYMSDHVYLCSFNIQFIFSCVASSKRVGVLLHFLAYLTTIGIHTILFLIINPFTD